MATIKDVAREAGVSIATVSHYLNNTRYISPELAEKVKIAIEKTGYHKKIQSRKKYKIGRGSEVAIVVPNFHSTIYAKVVSLISERLAKEQLHCMVYFHNDDLDQERSIVTNLALNQNLAGALFVPVSREEKQFNKLIQKNIPLVFLGRKLLDADHTVIVPDIKDAIYQGCLNLLKAGHEDIAFILLEDEFADSDKKLEGYRLALEEYNLPYNQDLVVSLPNHSKELEKKIKNVWTQFKPSSFLAGSNRVTFSLMKTMSTLGVNIPGDVSVVGFGDEEWTEIVTPPLTTLNHNIEEIASRSSEALLAYIHNRTQTEKEIKIPMHLSINRSTQVIGKGPFGEKPVSPEELTFSTEDAESLRAGNFRVAISFHYGGTAWTRLYENGIRNILNKYGVSVISITDAHFDPELQVAQLEGLRYQKPDAIIAIPVDDELTAKQFQIIAEESKLIFMSHVPEGMNKEQYSACVSVNERESGYNTAVMLGNYFKKEEKVKIGFIGHGAPFYGTHLRDAVANDTIRSNFPNVEIVDEKYFYKIERTYDICKKMILDHPEIEGLYISWDQPALQAIRALKELNREDISIFTFDLDNEIAAYLANEHMVKGLSSQRPYEQGVAVGLATAKALINKDKHKYIAVQPYIVEAKNLLKAWKDIMSEPAPTDIEQIIKSTFT